MQELRAQLDEFLGKDRNLLPKDRVKVENDFNDPDICKFYLCGLCPHELFTNANIRDLGPCTKLHDENCVKQYQNCKEKDKYDYEYEWVRLIEGLISDNDKKIKRNKDRLLQNPNGDANHHGGPTQTSISQLDDEEGGVGGEKDVPNSKIAELDLKIQELLKKSEMLGEEGQITEAEALMTQADDLKNQKTELEKIEQEKNENKRMSVCEICGALLFVGDKEKRSISHLEGKKHIGFQKIREVMDEYYKSGRRASIGRGDGYRDNDRRYNDYGYGYNHRGGDRYRDTQISAPNQSQQQQQPQQQQQQQQLQQTYGHNDRRGGSGRGRDYSYISSGNGNSSSSGGGGNGRDNYRDNRDYHSRYDDYRKRDRDYYEDDRRKRQNREY